MGPVNFWLGAPSEKFFGFVVIGCKLPSVPNGTVIFVRVHLLIYEDREVGITIGRGCWFHWRCFSSLDYWLIKLFVIKETKL